MTPPRIAAILPCLVVALTAQSPEKPQGVRLEQHSWQEAEDLLGAERVVVLPLGAALSAHGPHLDMRNDLTLAEYFAGRVAAAAPVAVAPPLAYHFYPGVLEYAGSTSLTHDTARDVTVQVVRSLARSGPRRFYVLNTGASTTRPLEAAAAVLAREGILLRFTDFAGQVDRVAGRLQQQEGGGHADELETSMMLYIRPESVNMSLAVKDYVPGSAGAPLTRRRGGAGTYSASGVWGDPTLATREKGLYLVEAMTTAILDEIAALRIAALPSPSAAVEPSGRPMLPQGQFRGDVPGMSGCLPGVERDLKRLEAEYHTAWKNRHAEGLGGLWSDRGDIVHPDARTWKGRETIVQNLREQFRSKEFASARHSLTFGTIRCITGGVAVVDAKWDLREVVDGAGNTLPATEGFAALVLQGGGGEPWRIEAYRYFAKPGAPPAPVWLKKPGYPDKQ